MFCFVTLTCETRTHKVPDKATIMIDHELLTKPLQRLLCAFMANTVRQPENSGEDRGRRRDKHAGTAHDETVRETPGLATFRHNGVAQRTQVSIQLQSRRRSSNNWTKGSVMA